MSVTTATTRHRTAVLDSHIAHVESGPADATPVVLLHGNPTSSHLWRNVTPHLAPRVRTLAPDLIGMGDSGKPAIAYSYADQARYLEAWFDALGLTGVVLVGHDWGGSLALDFAARHPERVRGVALLETMLKPFTTDDLNPRARERFLAFRTPEVGEELILEQNVFIETAFTGAVLTPLSAEDVAPYRAPYPTPESRRPMLAWPRMLPLDGTPADVHERFLAYGEWLAQSTDTPKLLLTFEGSPTLLIGPETVEWARGHIAALEVRHLGPAGHHAPEDQPDAIGAAVADWLGDRGLAG